MSDETPQLGPKPSAPPVPPTLQPAPRKLRNVLLLVLAAVIAVLAAALIVVGVVAVLPLDKGKAAKYTAGEAPATPTTFTVTGTLVLPKADDVYKNKNHGGGCSGSGGYDDIRGGAQVVIYDNAGTMLASGSLAGGLGTGLYSGCRFAFSVPNVPIAAVDLYSVEVTSRGRITFTQADANDVELSLG